MLATVAPGADSYDETLGTLQYAPPRARVRVRFRGRVRRRRDRVSVLGVLTRRPLTLTLTLTLSLTLTRYASRAKTITLKARRNESMTEVGKLRKEVEELKAMLASATASAGEGASEAERARIEEYALQFKQYGEENQKLLQAESEHRALLATHGQESDAP